MSYQEAMSGSSQALNQVPSQVYFPQTAHRILVNAAEQETPIQKSFASHLSAADKVSVQVQASEAQTQRRVNPNASVFDPEILAGGGLEAALLFLMLERDDLFKNSLTSKINESKVVNERIRTNNQEQFEALKNAQDEMKTAQKFGRVASTLGWVSLAFSSLAMLSAPFGLPLIGLIAATAVTTAMQIDSATGGHVMNALSGGNENLALGLSIGIGVGSMLLSMGAASLLTSQAGKAVEASAKAVSGSAAAASGAGSAAVRGGASAAGQLANSTTGAALKSGGQVSDDLVAQISRLSSADDAFLTGGGSATKAATTASENALTAQSNPYLFHNLKNGAEDNFIVKISSNIAAGIKIIEQIPVVRGSVAGYMAEKFNSEALNMRANEKKLTAYLDVMQQVIEDILVLLSTGNKTVIRQLEAAFEPKIAISMGLKVGS